MADQDQLILDLLRNNLLLQFPQNMEISRSLSR